MARRTVGYDTKNWLLNAIKSHVKDYRKRKELEHAYICTYVHNWPLQPLSQDYGPAPQTAQVV